MKEKTKFTYEEIDQRITNSKVALSDAILEMIKINPRVKVLEICEAAHITPMTYYHHFRNKEELLEFAVKRQLSNILPIPRKLKPINFKHLLYYLTNTFNHFVWENKQLVNSSIKQIKYHGFSKTYLDLVFKVMNFSIKHEIELVCKDNSITVEQFNNIICGSLFNIIIQSVLQNKFLNNNCLWNIIKSLVTKLY